MPDSTIPGLFGVNGTRSLSSHKESETETVSELQSIKTVSYIKQIKQKLCDCALLSRLLFG